MGNESGARQEETWRVFLAYRRSDGLATAEWLHAALEQLEAHTAEGRPRLDIYLDRAAPGAGDFRTILRQHLAASRAMILVCTPDARERRPEADFLHDEIDWWLHHRRTPPILVDATRGGPALVPSALRQRWAHAQMVECVPEIWAADAEHGERLRQRCVEQVRRGVEISERGIRFEEFEKLRRSNRRLGFAVAVALGLAAVAWILALSWQEAEREAMRRGYSAEIAAAQRDVRAQDFAAARLRLADTVAELRGWEWGHLMRFAERSVRRFQRDSVWISCLARSRDGRKLLIGSRDGWLRLWDVEDGELLAEVRHGDTWIAGAFSDPSGEGFVTCDRAGMVRQWDMRLLPKGTARMLEGGGMTEMSTSPDGTQVATACRDGNVRIYGAAQLSGAGRLLVEGVGEVVLGWSWNSRSLALGRLDGGVLVVDAATGNILLAAHPLVDAVTAVAFSADDREIVAADLRGLIAILDPAKVEVQGGFRPFDADEVGSVLCLSVLPGSDLLLAGDSNHLIRAWNLADRTSLGAWPGLDADVEVMIPGPEDLTWFSGSEDGDVRLWSLDPAHQPLRLVETEGDVWSLALAPDGEAFFAATGAGGIEKRSLSGELLGSTTLPARANQLVCEPEGTRLVAIDDDGRAHILRMQDLKHLGNAGFAESKYRCATFVGDRLALGTGAALVETTYGVELRDLTDGSVFVPVLQGSHAVEALATCVPGGRVAVASEAPAVRLLDPAGRAPMLTWDKPEATASCLASDPRHATLAAGLGDGSVVLLDAVSGRLRMHLRGHLAPVRCLAFSQDGERLFSGSEAGDVRVWDTTNGRELLLLPQGNQVVLGLAPIPDGKRLVVGCCEPLVRIWQNAPEGP